MILELNTPNPLQYSKLVLTYYCRQAIEMGILESDRLNEPKTARALT